MSSPQPPTTDDTVAPTTTWTGTSRRRHARVPLAVPVSLLLSTGAHRDTLSLEISREGLSVMAPRPVAPGTRCVVRLSLPGQEGELVLPARSIYSSYTGPSAFRIGLVFAGLDAAQQDAIARFTV